MKKFKTLSKIVKEIETASLFEIEQSLNSEEILNVCKEYKFPMCTSIYNRTLLDRDATTFGTIANNKSIFWYENRDGGVKIYCINDGILESKSIKLVDTYKRMLKLFNNLK
jgi:hypothetical protein